MIGMICVEGGGNTKTDQITCRQGFSKLFVNCGLKRKIKIVACGSRNSAYQTFRSEIGKDPITFTALLVDSEDPITDIDKTWEHLRIRDQWERPQNSHDENVLLMTTCMETLIVADPQTLKEQFQGKGGKPINLKLLPEVELESRSRDSLLKALEKATAACKAPYKKGDISFRILGALNPQVLENKLPSFKRAIKLLRMHC